MSVVLLRGVNVGGHRTFRPSALAKQLRHLDAVSIGAAGTFVIRKSLGAARLRAEFARRLPFETQILICEDRDIRRLLARHPGAATPKPSGRAGGADRAEQPKWVRFVTVLAATPRAALKIPLQLPASGRWCVRMLAREGRFVVGVYRRQPETVRYLGTFDKLFGVPTTTRNWNTVEAVGRVLGDLGTTNLA